MPYSCTFVALSLVAKVCLRPWKSPIPDSLTARSKQTINWRRFLPVRDRSKINSSSGASCRRRFRIPSARAVEGIRRGLS